MTRFGRLFGCAAGLLLGAAGARAGLVTASFDLDGNGSLESSATSDVAGGIVNTQFTITHTVANGLAAGAETFTWTGPGFTGTVKAGKSVSTVFTTSLSVVEDGGTIAFAPSAVGGPAQYNKPVVSAVLYYAGGLISSLFKSPSHIDFESTLVQLGPNSFEYTYKVTNFESVSVPFAWDAAGFSGTVSAGGVATKTVLSSSPAVELPGHATFTLPEDGESFEWVMPADALVPAAVPEPASVVLLAGGVVGLAVRPRRRPR